MRPLVLTGRAAREAACVAVYAAPDGHIVRISKPKRTKDQNAKLWPSLEDIAAQVKWDGETLDKYEWKDFFTAALKRARMVRGMDGGVVFVGLSSSAMDKETFSELLTLIEAFGAEHEVKWTDGR